jgi:hypothetical protein
MEKSSGMLQQQPMGRLERKDRRSRNRKATNHNHTKPERMGAAEDCVKASNPAHYTDVVVVFWQNH